MDSGSRENAMLVEKVQQLQREVRRLKQAGVSVATLFVILILGFRILGHRRVSTEQLVTKDLVLTDSMGGARARLTVFPEGSGLDVYAPSGERRARLIGSGEESSLNLYIPVTAEGEAAAVNLFHNNALMSSFRSDPTGARLEMHAATPQGAAVLAVENATASLALNGAGENVPKVLLEADATHSCATLGGMTEPTVGGSLCLHSPGLPSLELGDIAGNRAVLGIPHSTDLNTEDSSAASMVLKHKSGRKVHVAPH